MDVQVLKHCGPLHTYFPHGMVIPTWQLPFPSQVRGKVSVDDDGPSAHVLPEQTVPATYFWQPPVPLHRPLVPQLVAPWSLHIPRGSTAPAGRAVHSPSEPVMLQAAHEATQSMLQQ